MDRISYLPESIIHHILSLFKYSPAELVRMSVLSKTWFHLTASFPVLYFDIHKFRSRECFYKYVEYTTSRFCHQDDVTAHKFKLVTSIWEPAELDLVNRCLELLLPKGVRKLVIDFSYSPDVPSFRLPNTLLSVSVLESLAIWGCDLSYSFMFYVPNFKSLIRLELKSVRVNERVIDRLITSCPLLRMFHIHRCHGFKTFCVYGHQNLQQVSIWYITPVDRIDIDASNLTNLEVADLTRTRRGQPQMNLASCKKLTSVTYRGNPLPNSACGSHFLSNFPFLENFVLFTDYKGNNLKLSSHSLRTLVLNPDIDLEQIELGTPNLGLFSYSRSEYYTGLEISHLPHLKACMRCYLDDSMDALWFHKLRLFFDKENGFKALNLYIRTDKEFIVVEQLNAIELPPYELEHIELHFEHEESSDHAAFVDAVLCCFRPQSLTLRSSFHLTDFEEQSALVKFTYEKLLEQEFQGHTNIQIVSPYSSKAQKQFKGLMSLSGPLPHEEKAISFIKEKVFQEEAG